MSNRFFSPDQQFVSNTGVPYAGGFLYFYTTGTSTPLNTYSDQALTIANTNPVVLDSNGQAGSIFLQNLPYKVILQDSSSNQIWVMDPVYSSDYSTLAQINPYNGNPNGFVAGTAGTVGALPATSTIWDYVNNILYVCTTTGNAASAVWTAVNATAATPATPHPQGYLTVSSDSTNPVVSSDLVSQTTVYYTPFLGNLIPVYNGSSFITTSFTQLSLALSASHSISTVYDCFVFSNSGVLTLVTGPSWSVSTPGSGARGVGAGTTQLQRLNGLWVNAVQISARNGATTYTVPANTATYVGSLFIDTVAGQVTCHRTWGSSRKFGIWNAYNRVPIIMKAGDSTGNWTYSTNTVRAANASSANSISTFIGLPEEQCWINETQLIRPANMNPGTGITGSGDVEIGIGVNSIVAMTGTRGIYQYSFASNAAGQPVSVTAVSVTATAVLQPGIGVNTITALEITPTATNTTVLYFGTETNMVLSTNYKG